MHTIDRVVELDRQRRKHRRHTVAVLAFTFGPDARRDGGDE